MDVPAAFLYAESHEWLHVEGTTATVGITDHAQAELTDIVYVELPEVGRAVRAGEPVAVVESVKAASDIYAPASGTVTAVNEALVQDPGLLNREPHAAGWLWKMDLADPSETAALKTPDAYRAQIGA
jgi:glycine cleavage system H protein